MSAEGLLSVYDSILTMRQTLAQQVGHSSAISFRIYHAHHALTAARTRCLPPREEAKSISSIQVYSWEYLLLVEQSFVI
jgi:hypothetical protein